tara:strand:+ start:250 stop:573 length:324 start_codon:yes stop_codon:yes gene_type:complete
MPLYDPDGTKQKPILKNGKNYFSHATCPVNETHQKRPSYVVVNDSGSYAFCYDSGSHGTATTYLTGSVVNEVVGAGGIRLDINPVAWRRCDGVDSKGQVTFVYVRVS